MAEVVVMGGDESRGSDIFLHLKSKGYDVYSPGVKVGDCTSKYIVVKNDGSNAHPFASSDVAQYAVMCYVPQLRYSEIEPFVQSVKKDMIELYPMIIPYGFESPSYYDDTYKAHMVSISYKNYKKRYN